MSTLLESPSLEDQKLAREGLPSLTEVVQGLTSKKAVITFPDDNVKVVIPKMALEALMRIMDMMSDGKVINLFPMESQVTTQQAADMLNISRSYLLKLIDTGEIPVAATVGKHRRIDVKDIDSYRKAMKEKQEISLRELSRKKREFGFGLEDE